MKHTCCTTRVLRSLLAGSLLAAALPLLADPAAECRQEVQDYAIPPEQAAQYLDDCILSRGGLPDDPAASDTPVTAEDAVSDPMTDTEQSYDAGQPDEVLPGDANVTY